MAKTLIFTDTQLQAEYAANWNKAKVAVQAVLTLYAATGLPALVNSEFSSLFNNTDSLLFDKLTGGGSSVLTFGEGEGAISLPVVRSQAMELIAKPTGYNALINGIKQLDNITLAPGWGMQGRGKVSFKVSNISKHFRLDGAGALQFSVATAADIADFGKHYVKTQHVKNLHAFTQAVVEAYYENDLHNSDSFLNNGSHDIAILVQQSITKLNIADESYTPNYSVMVNIDNNLLRSGVEESE